MRVLFAVPLLLLGACQVTKDDNSTTLSFNEDVAANAAEDIGNAAENLGGAIAKEADQTAAKVENKVGDIDVDVKTDGTKADANAN